MAIYEIKSDRIEPIAPTTFGLAGVRERHDLQRLLRQRIDIVAPDTLVIAEEFGEWDESRRRIDLLGIDKEANLVVIDRAGNRVGRSAAEVALLGGVKATESTSQ